MCIFHINILFFHQILYRCNQLYMDNFHIILNLLFSQIHIFYIHILLHHLYCFHHIYLNHILNIIFYQVSMDIDLINMSHIYILFLNLRHMFHNLLFLYNPHIINYYNYIFLLLHMIHKNILPRLIYFFHNLIYHIYHKIYHYP